MFSRAVRTSLTTASRSFSTSAPRNADFTHAVIGGGVVGLAIARKLQEREGVSTVLIERHGSVGTETSSRNSEVCAFIPIRISHIFSRILRSILHSPIHISTGVKFAYIQQSPYLQTPGNPRRTLLRRRQPKNQTLPPRQRIVIPNLQNKLNPPPKLRKMDRSPRRNPNGLPPLHPLLLISNRRPHPLHLQIRSPAPRTRRPRLRRHPRISEHRNRRQSRPNAVSARLVRRPRRNHSTPLTRDIHHPLIPRLTRLANQHHIPVQRNKHHSIRNPDQFRRFISS